MYHIFHHKQLLCRQCFCGQHFVNIITRCSFSQQLTGSGGLALADWLHDADATAGLQRRLQPVGGVVHVGHVDAQAAVLTQQDHGGALLLAAGRVADGHHILDL